MRFRCSIGVNDHCHRARTFSGWEQRGYHDARAAQEFWPTSMADSVLLATMDNPPTLDDEHDCRCRFCIKMDQQRLNEKQEA
jgi:hypothetical protein